MFSSSPGRIGNVADRSTPAFSFHSALELNPILECRDGLLRSSKQSVIGTWVWKKRCFVLLNETPGCFLRNSVSGLDQGWGEPSMPVLLLYETVESVYPSFILRIISNMLVDTETSLHFDGLDDHPKHLKVKFLTTLPHQNMFLGPDRGTELRNEASTLTGRSWRLKLPDHESATLWKDAMRHLSVRPPPALEPGEASGEDSLDEESTSNEAPLLEQDHLQIAPETPRLYFRSLFRLTFFLPVFLMAIQVTLFSKSSVRKENNSIGTEMRNASLSLDAQETAFVSETPRGEMPEMLEMTVQDDPRSTMCIMRDWFKTLFISSSNAVRDAFVPSALEERPRVEQTVLRKTVLLLLESCSCFGIFQPGSLVSQYFWLIFPAVIVILISSASILCRVFPSLRAAALSKHKFWLFALFFFLAAVLLGHDTFVNHWRQPLRYRLYWQGYLQLFPMLGCVGAANTSVAKARGRRPRNRNPISTQRKVTAGLSGSLALLALPLALRSVEEAGGLPAIMSFVSFFSGLHFFGWAMRALVVFGTPIGDLIYRFSLLPSNLAYWALYALGDACQHTFRLLSCVFLRMLDIIIHVARKAKEAMSRWWPSLCCVLTSVLRILNHAFVQVTETLPVVLGWVHLRYYSIHKIIAAKVIWVSRSLCQFWQRILNESFKKMRFCVNIMASYCRKFAEWIGFARAIVYHSLLEPFVAFFCRCCRGLLERLALLLCKIRLFFISILHVAYKYGMLLCKTSFSYLPVVRRTIIVCSGALLSGLEGAVDFAKQSSRRVHNSIILPVFEAVSRLLHVCHSLVLGVINSCRSWLDPVVSKVWIIITQRISPAIHTVWTTACTAVAAVIGTVLQKYWQLIPAGLVFNGSFLYAGAAIRLGSGGWWVRLKYVLGSWSLFLIGCTILHAVMSSPGNLVNQRVVTEESIIKYVDFRLFFALGRLLVSGWHSLSTALVLALNSVDFLVRKSLQHVWLMLKWLREDVLKPAFQFSSAGVRTIWGSPYLSMFLSTAIVGLAYLRHAEYISLDLPVSWKFSPGKLYEVLRGLSRSEDCILGWLEMLSSWAARVCGNVYDPLINVDVSSSSTALSCWVFTCILTKTKSQVRIKMFAVPVVVFYVTGVAATALVRASTVSICAWFILSIFVDGYEQRETTGVRRSFRAFQRRKLAMLRHLANVQTSAPNSKFKATDFHQSECIICLDALGSKKCALSTLPCGHTFHRSCVNEWLQESSSRNRCPICRRAAGGQGRLLEVIF